MKKWLYKLLTQLRSRIKPEPPSKRVCALCGQQIKRNHRWYYRLCAGARTGDVSHYHCDNPTLGPGPIPDAEPVEMVMP